MLDGLVRAQNAGIPTSYRERILWDDWSCTIDRFVDNLVEYKKRYPEEKTARYEYDHDLAQLLLRDSPDLVVCAGWMHSKRLLSS